MIFMCHGCKTSIIFKVFLKINLFEIGFAMISNQVERVANFRTSKFLNYWNYRMTSCFVSDGKFLTKTFNIVFKAYAFIGEYGSI